MIIKAVRISDSVAEKIARKHDVEEEEVHELFWNEYDKPLIRRSDKVPGTYPAYGKTEAGRCLVAAFVLNPDGEAGVLTARHMTKAERRLYERK